MTQVSKFTYFWHILRSALFFLFCKTFKRILKSHSQILKNRKHFLTLASFLFGTTGYLIASKILDKILCYFYKMHELAPFDEFWLYEKVPNQLGNTATLLRTNKLKFETFKNFAIREFCNNIPKTKVILKELFGRFYWVEL